MALDDQAEASGALFWDDGQSLDQDWSHHSKIEFEVTGAKLTSKPAKTSYSPLGLLEVDEVEVMGLDPDLEVIGLDVDGAMGECEWNQTSDLLTISCVGGFNPLENWSLKWLTA